MTRRFRIALFAAMTLFLSAAMLPAQFRQMDRRDTHRYGDGSDRSYYSERSGRSNYRNDEYGYRSRYNDGRYYGDDYDRRHRAPGASAAIIAGGAGAGAAIGAVSGGGRGAVIGAAIGGVSGLIIDRTTRHRHH